MWSLQSFSIHVDLLNAMIPPRSRIASSRCSYSYRPNAYLRRLGPLVGARSPFLTYSSQNSPNKQEAEGHYQEKAALLAVHGSGRGDLVNPPISTIPPPLLLPERGSANQIMYYLRVGRAYAKFYWSGTKAVWFNYQAASALRKRINQEVERRSGAKTAALSTWLAHITRSEFQLLERNDRDIRKLPFFGLLLCLFGEWLPVIVPFIPNAVPGTCRIPRQIQGMRSKAEERRRISFRRGISEPADVQDRVEIPDHLARVDWPLTQQAYSRLLLERFRDDQLLHLSSTLNNHHRLWDRVQVPPAVALLRRGLSRKLAYLGRDDNLLSRDGGASRLSCEEVSIACEERGLDVLGKSEDTLRADLSLWLAHQKSDAGRGSAMLTMLFRRPNAWGSKFPSHKR